ncbi:MAG: MBL fold metallo-hydrolase, partial [Bacteroidaceae bacterium]|nr:MBL fold metallo-hydrolase [Bacteroidaceae bacterium]
MKKILFCMCAFISLSACGQRGVNSVEADDSVEAVDSVDTFDTPDGYTATITPLLHASIRIQSGGFEIEVDPVAKLGDRTTDYSAMPEADLILVTHEHFDHFDTATIKRLSTENTITVMNPRCH